MTQIERYLTLIIKPEMRASKSSHFRLDNQRQKSFCLIISMQNKNRKKNKLNDMWFFKSILYLKETRKNNIAFASKEHHYVDEKTKRNCVQMNSIAAIELFFSKKKVSSFLNTKIMCLKIDNYMIQKSLNKRSSSQKSKITTFSSTTRRRSVNVLQMINNQNVNNALTILWYKFFEKKSRERSRQQNADNTTTTNTQNEKLWIHNER
jgi:hypothetical protein